MADDILIGDKAIIKMLDELPNAISKRAIQQAARTTAKPILRRARARLRKHVGHTGEGGFSKLMQVVKATKIVTSRSRINPGVNVLIKGKDMPVGNRFWRIRGYAQLLAFGRSTGAPGFSRGFGDWIVGTGTSGVLAKKFRDRVLPEVQKAISRTKARHGIKR